MLDIPWHRRSAAQQEFQNCLINGVERFFGTGMECVEKPTAEILPRIQSGTQLRKNNRKNALASFSANFRQTSN